MLTKKRKLSLNITARERNPEDATYGFGIALQQSSWEFIAASDQ